MTDFRIACQTITWGDTQKEHFAQVFDEVAAGGYAGVEIGFRHVREMAAGDLKKVLGERGLSFAALHIGGNLLDASQAHAERQVIDEALDFLHAMDCPLLMYSGLRFKDSKQFARDFDMINQAAEKCQSHGVRLLYHNHNWEFADNGRVIKPLLWKSSPALGFCPDIGWVMKGGWGISEFLRQTKGRIGAIHFKDFATDGPECDTVILGTGIAPLAEAAEWIKANSEGMWVIAEQDKADVPPGKAAARNADYLKDLFS